MHALLDAGAKPLGISSLRIPLGKFQRSFRRLHPVDHLLDDLILALFHGPRLCEIRRRSSHVEEIGSLLADIGRLLLTVGGENQRRRRKSQNLTLPRSQLCRLVKGHQLQRRLFQFTIRFLHIELRHFLAGSFPGVGNLHADGYRLLPVHLVRSAGHVGQRKGSVGQAKAERIGRFFVESGEIAVAHIKSFLVDCINPHIVIRVPPRLAARAVVEIL